MNEKLVLFKEKVEKTENSPLVDSLIEHAKKSDENIEFYEATKILKNELLKRLKYKRFDD